MPTPDEFSTYIADLLNGTYDCVDRISLRGYFPMGQISGGLLIWWNQLYPGTPLTQQRLRSLSGDLARRVLSIRPLTCAATPARRFACTVPTTSS